MMAIETLAYWKGRLITARNDIANGGRNVRRYLAAQSMVSALELLNGIEDVNREGTERKESQDENLGD